VYVGVQNVIQKIFSKIYKHYPTKSNFPIVFKKIGAIEGVGFITATAIVAAVGDPSVFKNGREFSSWLGLVPKQRSTGGKNILLGISKRGNPYIRKNLIHGCRSIMRWVKNKDDKKSRWIQNKIDTKGFNRAVIATANKTARVIWVLLANEEERYIKAA